MSLKIPKIVLGVPVIIAIAVILSFVLDDTNVESIRNENPTSENSINTSSTSMNNLYSGPFAILDGTYAVDDTLFLIGSEIPLDSKGKITIIRPDGKIHHTLHYDGSKSALNHYFTPVSLSDLEECLDCEFFGTWTISFRADEGISYNSMIFDVIEENNEKDVSQ